MKKIASFCVDHTKLIPGLYVSRLDEKDGLFVTTFDLRVTKPNVEPPMQSDAIHTIEHIVATFLRNSEMSSDIVYFGPMGCKTGFYLVVFGNKSSLNMLEIVKKAFQYVVDFEGEIPGASEKECGNYLFQNLNMAKFYAKSYLDSLEKYKSFDYPQ